MVTAAAALLLALHWWLGVTGWFGKTVTSDETAHLVSGYSYWKFNDYRLQPENGNLPQRWGALPLLLQQPQLEPGENPSAWSLSHVWAIGQKFFFESGNNTDYMLATARATMAGLGVLTGLMVYLWSRQLWGAAGGLLSLALYAVSPTMLAHTPLVTSDAAAMLCLLAASGAYWRHLQSGQASWWVLSPLATGLAAVAKFSFLILGPVFAILIAAHLTVAPGPRRPQIVRVALSVATHAIAAVAVVWTCFGFRHSGFAPDMPAGWKYYIPWSELLPAAGFWRHALLALKEWQLLPEAYVHGFAYVLHAAQNRGAFLAGEHSQTGWWWFFPYAFAIKSSLAELATWALAALVIARRWVGGGSRGLADRLRPLRAVLPLLALFLVYWAASVTSNLNIGHRHLLPIYPPLFIIAGLLLHPGATRWLRIAAGALAGLAALESASARPHYLAYFNASVGGADQGWRHLVDSSLDWGQDLPGLSAWLREHRQPGEKVYLSYFGMGDPRYEGIAAESLAPYFQHYRPREWRELEPGLYCIGATMLQDPYSPWNGPWTARHEGAYRSYLQNLRRELAEGRRSPAIEEFGEGESNPLWNLDRLRFARLGVYLRRRPPDAIVNHSILVFRLRPEEIRTAVDGTPEELAELMERALDSK